MSAASGPACGHGDDRASRASWFRSRSFRPAPTTRPFYAQTQAAGVSRAVRLAICEIASIEVRDSLRRRSSGKQTPRPDKRERGVSFAACVSEYAWGVLCLLAEIYGVAAVLLDRDRTAGAHAGGGLRAVAGFIGVRHAGLGGLQRTRVILVGDFGLVAGLFELDEFRAHLGARQLARRVRLCECTVRRGTGRLRRRQRR